MTDARSASEGSQHRGLAAKLRSGAQRLLRALFLAFDFLYRKWHRLQAIDHLLQIEIRPYRGPARRFDDGTVVHPGDTLAILHFSNALLIRIHERATEGGHPASLAFGMHLIRSLHRLAGQFTRDPALAGVTAVTGVTWFKPHGGSIGFYAEALPAGLRRSLLKLHFRILLAALFPRLAERENRRLRPHRFWLTRQELFETLDEENNHVVQRLAGRNQERAAL